MRLDISKKRVSGNDSTFFSSLLCYCFKKRLLLEKHISHGGQLTQRETKLILWRLNSTFLLLWQGKVICLCYICSRLLLCTSFVCRLATPCSISWKNNFFLSFCLSSNAESPSIFSMFVLLEEASFRKSLLHKKEIRVCSLAFQRSSYLLQWGVVSHWDSETIVFIYTFGRRLCHYSLWNFGTKLNEAEAYLSFN